MHVANRDITSAGVLLSHNPQGSIVAPRVVLLQQLLALQSK